MTSSTLGSRLNRIKNLAEEALKKVSLLKTEKEKVIAYIDFNKKIHEICHLITGEIAAPEILEVLKEINSPEIIRLKNIIRQQKEYMRNLKNNSNGWD